MNDPASAPPAPARGVSLPAIVVLIAVVFACSLYANLSFAVTSPADYRFFPPFQRSLDANYNSSLAGENFNIAQSLVAGKGFANPFPSPGGSTAWMPPLFPTLLAGLLWVFGGQRDAVLVVVIFVQLAVLIGTGLLVLALARQTTRRVGSGPTATLFCLALVSLFHWCFQTTGEWPVLLALDLLIAGLCWWRPLSSLAAAAGWGLFGGLCALVNPIAGLTWGLLSLLVGWRDRAWSRLALAGLVAGLTLVPWTVRNYLVFGRLIPVKSNLAYELYQSQCMQPDGLVQRRTLRRHPYTAATPEGREYHALGEIAYLDRKHGQFREAVSADPLDFLRRLAQRFLGATLWYEPFDRGVEAKRPWSLWLGRLTHPWPFLALLALVGLSARRPLHRAQWVVIGIYLLYLLPYVGISYYERYAVPLVGVKVLLVVWAIDRCLAFHRGHRTWNTLHPRLPAPADFG
jgi:hypothetical protein